MTINPYPQFINRQGGSGISNVTFIRGSGAPVPKNKQAAGTLYFDTVNQLWYISCGYFQDPIIGEFTLWQVIGNPALTIPIPIASGGTASTSFNINGAVISGSTTTSPLTSLTMSNGQLLIGATGAAPAVSTITAGAGISVVNGANSITISASTATVIWNNISASQALAVNQGYFVDATGGAISLSLPATASVGDTIRVYKVDSSVNQVKITQGAGQSIQLGSSASTTGVAGYIESTAIGNTVELICQTANTGFKVGSSMGNWTVA